MFRKPPTFRSKKVLDYVKSHSCLLCGAPHPDPHHLPSPLGGSRRAVDIAVPLCRRCHDRMHDHPYEEKDHLPRFYSWALGAWMEVHDISWGEVWAVVLDSAGKG